MSNSVESGVQAQPCEWGGLTRADVARAANAGSYDKAVGLVQEGAARVLIRCADGAVETSVRSEHGNHEYAVRVLHPANGKIAAKCTCTDYKRRGGLCKHGAASLLLLMNGGIPCKDASRVEDPRFREVAAKRRPAGKP